MLTLTALIAITAGAIASQFFGPLLTLTIFFSPYLVAIAIFAVLTRETAR